jgi:sulfatase modifying factor 1
MERAQAVFRMKLWSSAFVMLVTVTAITACAHRPCVSGGGLAPTLSNLWTNVVRIVAARQGFGFVVGEARGWLYIVTADHVVRREGGSPDDIDQPPTVTFFQDQGTSYPGKLAKKRLSPKEGDLAVLVIQPPPGFVWHRKVRAPGPAERGTDVWFIGKGDEWYVPPRPGAFDRIESTGAIRVEGLPVIEGTSGAPLISQKGILGMVLTTEGVFSRAMPLDIIQREVEQWGYPWQLAPMSIDECGNDRVILPP